MLEKINEKMWKHSWLIALLDKLDGLFSSVMPLTTIFFTAICIGFPTLCVYITLDDKIRNIVTPIISSLFSLIIVPLVLNHVNNRTEKRQKAFEKNQDIYIDFINIIFKLTSKSEFNEVYINELKTLYNKNISQLSISLPYSFLKDFQMLISSCERNSRVNFYHYAEKCIKFIRKQSGIKGEFYLSVFYKTEEIDGENSNQE